MRARPAQAHSYPASVNRQLAEVHYKARVMELRDLILQEETRFKCVGFASRVPGSSLTAVLTTRTLLTEIEEIRSGLWDERIKTALGIVSPEPIPEAPPTPEVTEVIEEPTIEIEDVSMIDIGSPQQDEPIIIDDSDATTDEPPVAQQVSQVLEEEEVDLHLTPTSIPSSPKPTEGADTAQERVEVMNEGSAQPVQEPQEAEPLETQPLETEPRETEPREAEPREVEPREVEPQEAEPQSPFTEQDPEERDAEGLFGASPPLSGLLTP